MTPDQGRDTLTMCGVLAWVGVPGSQPRRDQLERMNDRMTHAARTAPAWTSSITSDWRIAA